MATPANITLATARTRATSFSPRVFILHMMLYGMASAVLSVISATVMVLVLGWNWLLLAAIAIVAGTALTFLWGAGTVGFLLQGGATGEQRRTRGWVLAVVLVAIAAALAPEVPWWSALVTMVMGIGATPLLAGLRRRIEATRLTSWDLPPALLLPLQALPPRLPMRVDTVLERAFRDWMHLRQLLAFTADSGLRSFVDKGALLQDAERSVLYLLRRATLVAKLVQLAEERREEHASKAADKALQRLDAVGATLHDAVAAASQFAASEQRDEGLLLKARVETLKELAAGLDVDAFEVVEEPARLASSGTG